MWKTVTKRYEFAGVGMVNETELALLAEFARRCGGRVGVYAPASLAELVLVAGRRKETVRRVCQRLEERGLLCVAARYAEDGGQLSNAYALTAVGMALTRANARRRSERETSGRLACAREPGPT